LKYCWANSYGVVYVKEFDKLPHKGTYKEVRALIQSNLSNDRLTQVDNIIDMSYDEVLEYSPIKGEDKFSLPVTKNVSIEESEEHQVINLMIQGMKVFEIRTPKDAQIGWGLPSSISRIDISFASRKDEKELGALEAWAAVCAIRFLLYWWKSSINLKAEDNTTSKRFSLLELD
jgi:hypothetical protein